MDEARAAGRFYLLEAAGAMEMAVDVLNLFLIKEKALACIRDELLEREPGRRSCWEVPAQQGGETRSPPRQPLSNTRRPRPAETRQPLPPASPSQFQQTASPRPSPAPSGMLQGLSHRWARLRQQCGPGQAALLLALSLLSSKVDTRSL